MFATVTFTALLFKVALAFGAFVGLCAFAALLTYVVVFLVCAFSRF
jgi:hypothetical protein